MLARVADTILNPDNTKTPAFDPTSSMALASDPSPPWDDGDPTQAICGMFAAQVALARLVLGLRVQVGSFENLLKGSGSYTPTRAFKIHHVIFDMPADDEIQPFNASIIERSPQVYDDDFRPYMLKEQWNGYSLRVLAKSTVTLGLACWFGHTNERRAFRAALCRSLLAEQRSERASRVVTVPEYFGQTVRLILSDVQNVDEDPLANHRTLQASITSIVPEVVAVRSPETVKVQFMPTVGVDVNP